MTQGYVYTSAVTEVGSGDRDRIILVMMIKIPEVSSAKGIN